MEFTWHISILLFLLVLGGRMEHPASLPNQEIVLEFQEDFQNETETSEQILRITNRLSEIGATSVRVLRAGAGTYKIVYFSAHDIQHIKEMLNEDAQEIPENNPFEVPSEKHFAYKLEIVKIQDQTLFENAFQGTVVEIKSVPDQYLKPKFPSVSTFSEITLFQISESSENLFCALPIHTLEPVAYSLPEVRAGPVA